MAHKYVNAIFLPKCCKTCRHVEHDYVDDYSPSLYFCTKGFFLPTKSHTCAKNPAKVIPINPVAVFF